MIDEIISEEILDHELNETYKSVNEIKTLASNVIREIAKNNERQINQRKDPERLFLYGTSLKDQDSTIYKEIKDFVDNLNVYISIGDKKTGKPHGSYSVYRDKYYNPYSERELDVNVDFNKLKEDINREMEKKGELDSQDLFLILFNPLYKTLLHELQHAYDDYRSKGKSYQTKEFDKYRKKYLQSDVVGDITKNGLKRFEKYVNLPHEIWARFTQAMYDTHFIIISRENNEVDFIMKPIKEVVKDFKTEYDYFDKLSDKMKKN